ncbi:MAG: hypothetical protein J5786_07180 [Clostridiales bacterium]|nr:hypothetical protein [Clostridiales bacterium]
MGFLFYRHVGKSEVEQPDQAILSEGISKTIGGIVICVLSLGVYKLAFGIINMFVMNGIEIAYEWAYLPAALVVLAGLRNIIRGISAISVYMKQKKAWDEYKAEWDEKKIFDRFAKEYDIWAESGKLPETADRDLGFVLDLQQERLKKIGVKMICDLEPQKINDQMEGTAARGNFIAYRNYRTVKKTLRFENAEGKKLFKEAFGEKLCETIMDTTDSKAVFEKAYICPGCGAETQVKNLLEGCSSCGARYEITELFPKVTDYFFMQNAALEKDKKRDKGIIKTFGTVFAIAAAVIALNYVDPVSIMRLGGMTPEGIAIIGGADVHSADFLQTEIASYYISTMIVTALFSSLFGYIFGTFIGGLINKVINNAGRSTRNMIAPTAFIAKGEVEKAMAELDPKFNYELFESKVVSLIKMTAFADDPSGLAVFWSKNPVPKDFKYMVNIDYDGQMVYLGKGENDNLISIQLLVYILSFFEVKGKVFTRPDRVVVTVTKRKDALSNPAFSMHRVTCENCGSSFNAVRQKNCEYCGAPYDLKNKDWVITEISLKGRK